MYSAFGVDHGEFSKAFNSARMGALSRAAGSSPKTLESHYAAEKFGAKAAGRVLGGSPRHINPTAFRMGKKRGQGARNMMSAINNSPRGSFKNI